jgi:hypothetical protein
MKWIFEIIEKYATEIWNVINDAGRVIGSPAMFFSSLSKSGASTDIRIAHFAIFLTLALVALETPMMISVGVAATDYIFVGAQILMTLLMFLLYALCFHLLVVIFVKDSSYLCTFKVIIYSSVWFLLAYLPLYLFQLARFQAMSETQDVLGVDYYQNMRTDLGNASNLTTLWFVGLLFHMIFVIWIYKGLRIVYELSKVKSILTSTIGYFLMSFCVQYIQDPMTHHLIITFKKAA